jgi:hypothetical protein
MSTGALMATHEHSRQWEGAFIAAGAFMATLSMHMHGDSSIHGNKSIQSNRKELS